MSNLNHIPLKIHKLKIRSYTQEQDVIDFFKNNLLINEL